MTEMKWSSWLVLAFLFFVSCDKKEDPLPLPEQQRLEIKNYIETLSADNPGIEAIEDKRGFYYIVVNESLVPTSGNVYSIYFNISTLEGAPVASYGSANGSSIRLKHGANTVFPPGLDMGLEHMTEGDVYEFIFPSDLAYGELGIGEVLPPNAIVRIEVELVRVENEGAVFVQDLAAINNYIQEKEYDKDTANPVFSYPSGLRVYNGNPNSSSQLVIERDTVGINFRVFMMDGKTVDATYTGNNIFEFVVQREVVISGLYEGVKNMRLGESAVLMMPSELAYGPSVTVIPASLTGRLIEAEIIPSYAGRVPPFTPLVFEVTLRRINN